MAYELITVEEDPTLGAGYVVVTLNSPAKRNALSATMMGELVDAFGSLAESDTVGVTIAASGTVFSAGHDFADMIDVDLRGARELLALCTEMMTAIAAMPQVVLARVGGLATAAGCQLVASCDLAVAGESAAFAAPGGKTGLFCHTPMVAIARNLGRKRAAELALTGDVIDADTAERWGLINRVVPDEELVEAAAKLLQRATRGSAYSKAMGKQTLYTQMELPLAEAYRYAVEVMAAATQTTDAQAGIHSFVEKKPRPVWVNR